MNEAPIEVTIDLDEEMIDALGEKLREPERLKTSAKAIEGKTVSEVYDLSPAVTVGTTILETLSKGLRAKNNEDAGDLYAFIVKIRNIHLKAKGSRKWKLDEAELKKLGDFLKRVEVGTIHASPMRQGFMAYKMKNWDYQIETLKKKSESTDKT